VLRTHITTLSLLALLGSPAFGQLTMLRGKLLKRPTPVTAQPNIVVILADDFGVDLMSSYGEGAAPPCTPNLDQLAASSLLFRNAWANPTCSPTRSALLTGRYGFRTGIGTPGGVTLPLSETLIPELLESAGYASAAIGKWHLGSGSMHPNASGFGQYAGSLSGQLPDYDMWTKTVDGNSSTSQTYATTDTTDEASLAMLTLPEPWFLYVNYNAPHTPIHVPALGLCPAGGCSTSYCSSAGPGMGMTPAERIKSMCEAMDTEIGRLLALLDALDPQAYVIFMGDNGTSNQGSEPPFVGTKAKGTVYEGGINVPFIVRGPGVTVTETQSLVSVTDLHATLAELAGVQSQAEDSISIVPVLSNPALTPRHTVYSETFSPNGSGPWTDHRRAVRDDRYKLIRRLGQSDEFYDLLANPFETINLLPGLSVDEQTAFDALAGELVALGVD
jgi:arylsulfatase A-like enzyme